MTRSLICFSLCFWAIISICLGQTGDLKGTIIATDSSSIQNINIKIKNTTLSTTSLSDGSFTLHQISPGKYTLEVTAAHIQTEEINVLILDNETTRINITVSPKNTQLDEVVVSAGRTSEKISEIPASISVVTLEKISGLSKATSNISNILEFAVPGLGQSTGTFSNSGQSLRGRNLLVMIDGVPQSTPLRNGSVDIRSINPNDLSRVEVIKGATSIFGNGSSGGFINYITKNTPSEKVISGQTEIWGTGNLAKLENFLGGGIYQSLKGNLKKFGYYISGSYEKTGNRYDAYGKPIFPIYGLDNTQITSGFAKINYQINDLESISLRSNLYKTIQNSPFKAQQPILTVLDAQGNYDLQYAIGVPGKEPGVGAGVFTVNNQLEYEIKKIFNGTTHFTVDLYQQYAKNIFFYSADSFENGGQSVIYSNKWGIRPNFNTQISIKNTNNLSLTYGLDVLRDQSSQSLLDGRGWVPNVTLLNIAPYLQSSFKIKNEWAIKVGTRFDNMNFNVVDYATLPRKERANSEEFSPSIQVKGGRLNFNNLSYNAGIRYIAHKQLIPYINYAQGFSMPDIGRTLRVATSDNVKNITLRPVVTNNYELGLLSEFQHVRFEAVGYYSSSKYGVNLVFNDVSNRFEVSQNPQRIFGGEASVDFTYFQNQLKFGTSYSYVEGIQFTTENPYQLTYLIGTTINPPKLTSYISYQPSSKWMMSLRLLHSGARKRFLPKATTTNETTTYSYNNGQVPVKAYTTVDAQINYQLSKNWSTSLAINNIFNQFYLPPVYLSGAAFINNGLAAEGINSKLNLTFQF